ncbi:MAG: DUF1127 domain-containing protein [Alphaproteobacteria bacterium]|nr:DUF1127 domain-containing protein [Alphaproteobacteria bacterium]
MLSAEKNCFAQPVLRPSARRPGLFGLLRAWQARVEERAQLRAMPEFLLKDMGVSHESAQREAAKPFWLA